LGKGIDGLFILTLESVAGIWIYMVNIFITIQYSGVVSMKSKPKAK
jgi:hypothetical protein